MPRLLIAGFGYVGQAVAEVFRTSEWDIEGWTRSVESAQKFAGSPFPIRAVDISNSAQVRTFAGNFDWIIHCASSRGGDAEHYRYVYSGRRAKPSPLFSGSSIASAARAYRDRTDHRLTKRRPLKPTHETTKSLRETEDIVPCAANRRPRGRIYSPTHSVLASKFVAESSH